MLYELCVKIIFYLNIVHISVFSIMQNLSLSKMSLYRRTMEQSYREIKVMNWTSEAFCSY